MEIEKKYLIKTMPASLAGFACFHISQSYICREPVIRVRRKERDGQVSYRLTVKGSGFAEREELGLELTRDQYERLLAKKEGKSIEKDRYLIPLPDGHRVELDIFGGDHEGLQLVEVEFSSREDMEAFAPPDWFGKEVTGDLHYYNSRLSQ